MLEKVSLSQQNNCENCHKEQSTGYCKQCSVFFCQTCVDKHNELFSSHQILGVEDVATTASKLVLLKKQSTTECSSHGKPLEVYCDTCDKLVCHLCTTAKVHRNHDYKPIADAFPRHQQQIVDSLKQVKKKLGGTDTLDTPLNVVEVMPRRARLTFSGLSPNSYTAGLAITREGHLIVAECSKYCITIIDPTNGKKIRSFGQCGEGQVRFNYPHGVAVTQDGCIVVSDYRNCSLQVLTAEGAFIATVGTKGFKPLQFDRPTGVAVHHNGQTFVSDAGNNRVQVLNADLTYSHCFGSKGAQPGDFNDPRGIAIDGDGMVYVADYNNRVQKFTPEGKLLAVIDSRLNCPDGLCFDANGLLYVVECIGNTVSMFSSKGGFNATILGHCHSMRIVESYLPFTTLSSKAPDLLPVSRVDDGDAVFDYIGHNEVTFPCDGPAVYELGDRPLNVSLALLGMTSTTLRGVSRVSVPPSFFLTCLRLSTICCWCLGKASAIGL